jgi:hypothetical protein
VSGKDLISVYRKTQDVLNYLHQWFVDNQLTLNIDKTCYSIFSNKKIPKKSLYINHIEIKRVNSVKYLAVYLDEKLT